MVHKDAIRSFCSLVTVAVVVISLATDAPAASIFITRTVGEFLLVQLTFTQILFLLV